MSTNPTASLKNIRTALLSGDFSALPDLTAEIEILAGRIAQTRPDMTLLHEVKVLAQCNLPLLEAARKGFADANERRRQIMDVANGLKTYNQSGQFRATSRPEFLERKS